MATWRALLLAYRRIDVRVDGLDGRFARTLTDDEVAVGVWSFERFPALAADLSAGEVAVTTSVVVVERPIASVTSMGEGMWWPSPADTRTELDALAPAGAYDSLFVLWAQRDMDTGAEVPSGGWGLAIPAKAWSNGATYATVGTIERSIWELPTPGEVWLHEWLHGVCDHVGRLGFTMPPGDADGGGRAGYRHDPAAGWSGYYRDLMTGRVRVGEQLSGIPAEGWRAGSILERRTAP